MPVAALDNWQPVWNAQVSISTPVCVNFELHPGAGDIHICWFNFDALAQGNAYKPTNSNRNETSCHPLLNAGFEPRVSDTKSSTDGMPNVKPTELSRIDLKTTWTRQCVPMISEHSAHSTSLPVGFRTWLWWYTCLLLILMLWHEQGIFKSKGDEIGIGDLLTLALGWSAGTGCTSTMLAWIILPRIRCSRSECRVWVDLGGSKKFWFPQSNSDKVWGFNFLPNFCLAYSLAFIFAWVKSVAEKFHALRLPLRKSNCVL